MTLRPLRLDHFDALYAAASDPRIWELHPIPDRYRREVFDIYLNDAIQSGGALIATDNQTREVIGSSRFHGLDEQRREIEIGWSFLIRRCWGGSFNREMKQLMLTHAFASVDSVIFVIGPNNLRSQMAIRKVGAVPDGARPDGSLVFRISRDRYPVTR